MPVGKSLEDEGFGKIGGMGRGGAHSVAIVISVDILPKSITASKES